MPAPINAAAPATQRLASLDALRGFDMFWILGADSLVYALHEMSPSAPTNAQPRPEPGMSIITEIFLPPRASRASATPP